MASCDDESLFRSRVVMMRHGPGRDEYQHFVDPLPAVIAGLRTVLYAPLAEIANRWNEAIGVEIRDPAEHGTFPDRCRAAGQTRSTPLLLRYGAGDYNFHDAK